MLFPLIIPLLQHDCLAARGARQKKWKRICLLSRWSKHSINAETYLER